MSALPQNVGDLAHLLKVIADETRLRILGVLATEPHTGKEIADLLDLSPPTISHHMRKLTDAGVVLAESDAQRQWYRLNAELLAETRRVPLSPAVLPASTAEGDQDADSIFRSKVIRDFFDGERLTEIPAQRKRRVIILQHLMERFDPERTYTELDINNMLKPAHEDVATLRRELVDYGFMQRDRGIYQVTRGAPVRDQRISQEITGDENAWLSSLLTTALRVQQPESEG